MQVLQATNDKLLCSYATKVTNQHLNLHGKPLNLHQTSVMSP